MQKLLSILLKIINTFRKIVWKIFKPVTFGVRVIIMKENSILLVKHRYDDFWYLPGGKIRKKEMEEVAAKREILEECYISITDFDGVLGRYKNSGEGKKDNITVLITKHWEQNKSKQNIEIEKARFFEMKNLPENVSPATKRRINELLSGQKETYRDW